MSKNSKKPKQKASIVKVQNIEEQVIIQAVSEQPVVAVSHDVITEAVVRQPVKKSNVVLTKNQFVERFIEQRKAESTNPNFATTNEGKNLLIRHALSMYQLYLKGIMVNKAPKRVQKVMMTKNQFVEQFIETRKKEATSATFCSTSVGRNSLMQHALSMYQLYLKTQRVL